MPALVITTNVPGDKAALSDTLKELSKAAASAIGKPESYMMVNIHTDSPLIFGGTEEPAANGTLHSIGAIGGEKNKAITKAIQDIVTAKLGVPNDRFYLAFHDMARSDMGFKGSTF